MPADLKSTYGQDRLGCLNSSVPAGLIHLWAGPSSIAGFGLQFKCVQS